MLLARIGTGRRAPCSKTDPKPPSIARAQRTVDFVAGQDVELALTGRHDPAIIRRICPVVTALVSVVLCDQLALRFGTDYLAAE